MTLFLHTYCSQCGADLGPGDEGVSRCAGHTVASYLRDASVQRLREIVDGATDKHASVWCQVGDLRAVLERV